MILLDKGRLLVDFDKDAENIIKIIRDVDGVMLTEPERLYVNHIVSGLKGIGVWTKIKALYGFVGGTAATHKWNWKDMRDADNAFRIVFGSKISHNSSGSKPTSMSSPTKNNVAYTGLIPNSVLDAYNKHIAVYTPDIDSVLNTTYPIDIGVNYPNSNNQSSLTSKFTNTGNTTYYLGEGLSIQATLEINKGFTVGSSLPSLNFLCKNSSIVASNTTTVSTSLPISEYTLFGTNRIEGSGPFNLSDRTLNFVSIGEGITKEQAIVMSHIITIAQGILGRK